MVIALLAGVGLVVATYFTAIAYNWIRPDTRWVPSFCRMGEQTCALVVFAPAARVFGVPNSLLGQVFYVGLLAATLAGWLEGTVLRVFLGISGVTVGLGLYLSYQLLVVLRIACPLCFTAHGVNLMLFAALWLQP